MNKYGNSHSVIFDDGWWKLPCQGIQHATYIFKKEVEQHQRRGWCIVTSGRCRAYLRRGQEELKIWIRNDDENKDEN